MFKFFFFLAVLVACALAETAFFHTIGPDCAFRFTVSEEEKGVPVTTEYMGYYDGENYETSVLKITQNPGDNVLLVRCDIRNETGGCYGQGPDEGIPCKADYTDFQEMFELVVLQSVAGLNYDTDNYPQDVECLDGSSGCKTYCNDADYCITVNPDNKLVQVAESGVVQWNVSWDKTPFEPSEFALDNCQGTALDEPVCPCSAPSQSSGASSASATSGASGASGASSSVASGASSSVASGASSSVATKPFIPVDLGCQFHFIVSSTVVNKSFDVYGLYNEKHPELAVTKMVYGEQYYLFRCDLGNATGFCYAQVNSEESSNVCMYNYCTFDEAYFFVATFFPIIRYPVPEYPKEYPCPDGSEGCQIYCNGDRLETCVVADKKGRIVSVSEEEDPEKNYNITYVEDAFEPSIFAMKTCDNTTELAVPTNPCPAPAPSGSSTASSTTPSTSTSTSTKGSSSSASFVQVAYALVLAALLVALF